MEDSQPLFARASAAIGRGDKLAAKHMLYELVNDEPGNCQAWLLLSKVVEDPAEVEICLRRALAIDPGNLEASRCLAWNVEGIGNESIRENRIGRGWQIYAVYGVMVLGFIILIAMPVNPNAYTFIFMVIFLVAVGSSISYSRIRDIIRIHRTPTCAINALPSTGLVEIVGKTSPLPIPRSLSDTPCVFWQAEIQEKKGFGRRSYWETIYHKSSEEPFEISDDTGTIKIFLHQAKLILKNNLDEGREYAFNPVEEKIIDNLQKMNINSIPKNLTIKEQLVKPNDQIYVLAEIQEMDGLNSPNERIVPLLISDRSERVLLVGLYARLALNIFLALFIGGLCILLSQYGRGSR